MSDLARYVHFRAIGRALTPLLPEPGETPSAGALLSCCTVDAGLA